MSVLCVLAVLIVGVGAPVATACFMHSPQPIKVWLDHVQVDITDQVAVKTYDCTFLNPNARAVVGAVCYMELEPGAKIDKMTVEVNGKITHAEILDVKKANKVFRDIVKNGGSPALLEYYGNQLVRTKVPRIPANGTVKVKLRYTQVLKKQGNVIRLQMLNTNPKAQMTPLKSASVTVNIKSRIAIKNVYSPTHEIKLVETPGFDVSVQWKADNYLPKHPFVLYYALGNDAVGAGLLAQRESQHKPGSFMLMLSPTFGTGTGAITDKQILPKDVVFCVDTSGSMIGKKMDQARTALKYCINHLRPKDRFNIVDFSTEARSFARELVPASEEMRKRALEYADDMAARGGTAIEEALELSLKQLGKSDRLKMILFATDGLPTIGERNSDKILAKVTQLNKEDVRIFVFGEGYNVNARLLDFLASQHRGEADYVMPKEKIEDKISAFFDRVGSPVMTDLEIEFDAGLKVTDMYPKRISDIFKGEQVIIFGQYEGSGPKEVRLTGYVQGVRQTFVYELNFPGVSKDDKNGFVPRLWAGAKVDHLLSEIRKSGKQDAELVNEITRLAKVYGIITPYTSYLMTDDTIQRGGSFGGGGGGGGGGRPIPAAVLGATRLKNQLKAGKADYDRAGADPEARKDSIARSSAQSIGRRRNQTNGAAAYYYEEAERQMNRAGRSGSSMTAVRYIASRTFYNAKGVWYQGDYDATKHQKKMKELKIGSDAYLQVLKDNPRMAKYMVFDEAVCNVGGNWYRVRR